MPLELYSKNIEVRWSDLDPNFHVRHSVYYDYGASVRIDFLQENGIHLKLMQEKAVGLVIFREECVFKKEIGMNDNISVDIKLLKATTDYSRWSIQHMIFKNVHTLSAILTLDGSWMDIIKRKLTMPPEEGINAFEYMPRAEQFEWLTKIII
ncbi:MAG: thioesterase family protein [Chitinophagaceae bacterium]